MEIIKVKHRDGKTSVIGEVENGKHKEKVSLLSCTDAPRPAFTTALEAVSADVLKACGIKGATFASAFTVYEVGVDTEDNGRRSFVFGAMLQTPWGPSKFPLPKMIERTENETDSNVLSDVAVKRIDKLLKCAKAYYAQDRVVEQMDALDGQSAAGAT